MTIHQALAELRAFIPESERSVFIKVEVKDYSCYPIGDPQRLQVEFAVWDERDSYCGATLEEAVSKCLKANAPDLKEAEAVAIEAVAITSPPSGGDIPF